MDLEKGFRRIIVVISVLAGIILFIGAAITTETNPFALLPAIRSKGSIDASLQLTIKEAKTSGKTDIEIWKSLLKNNEEVKDALSIGFTPEEIQKKLSLNIWQDMVIESIFGKAQLQHKITIEEFGKRVKQKYPEYEDIPGYRRKPGQILLRAIYKF